MGFRIFEAVFFCDLELYLVLNTTLPPRPQSELPHLGTYVREMAVSVERMYENALDWAHLPHLHASSFSAIELLGAEKDAWRARVWNPPPRQDVSSVIELRLDRVCRRWITRTLEGANSGNEVWTHCIPLAARRLIVVVDFFALAVAAAARARTGEAYATLYARLYDEDERMMLMRQTELDHRDAVHQATRQNAAINLGQAAALLARLPLDVTVGGERYRVALSDTPADHRADNRAESTGDVAAANAVVQHICAYALTCPHTLGPLEDEPIEAGQVICPWHGYRFDVHTGQCMEPATEECRLPVLTVITDENGDALLI